MTHHGIKFWQQPQLQIISWGCAVAILLSRTVVCFWVWRGTKQPRSIQLEKNSMRESPTSNAREKIKKTPTKLWKVKVFTSSHSTNYHPVIDASLNSKRSPFQGTSVIYSEQISFRTGQIFRPEEVENVAPFFCWQPRSPQQNVSVLLLLGM